MFITHTITAIFNSFLPKTFKPHDPIETSPSPKPSSGLSIVKKLNDGKVPIYLTTSRSTKQKYVMKVFYKVRGESNSWYKNEIRFATLKHPHVIDIVHYEDHKEILHRDQFKKASYILMEYAPYGDLVNFTVKHQGQIDEILVRTYFRQLIEGIEYLHTNAVAHLDLKPENLLIGANFNIKIADFDLSYIYGDEEILGGGTRYYRAPEFYTRSSSSSRPSSFGSKDLFAADIYSAGIILFILKTGMYPHAEKQILNETNYLDLMYNNNPKFWEKHCEIQGRESSFFSADFIELFNGMVVPNPKERFTIRQIKESKWLNGPIYTSSELEDKMNSFLKC